MHIRIPHAFSRCFGLKSKRLRSDRDRGKKSEKGKIFDEAPTTSTLISNRQCSEQPDDEAYTVEEVKKDYGVELSESQMFVNFNYDFISFHESLLLLSEK